MPRVFNIAGPCRPDLHYMLPAASRIAGVHALIDTQSYFVLHAPRQSGTTTAILELAAELTASGRYASAVLSLEAGGPHTDVERPEPAILAASQDQVGWQLPAELRPPAWPLAGPQARLGHALHA